eukprot:gnl/MRDRNA2_/MRDRNA2_35511_c0_seq1.p1 gnl/MRDRNA2_/MRDRNA2_35511_c0~~gnl/MRDRNA2_/MRDRNA2_35511_c0_seq1.p1  ORF type:complete len:161 (+),score=43.92 gnl/MRDRNA2_/MRDRNA2_35511_c0_seq1:60-542(+)
MEKRIDPEDNGAYTFKELSAHYKNTYTKKAIKEYWAKECIAIHDPKDDVAYMFKEKQARTTMSEYTFKEKHALTSMTLSQTDSKENHSASEVLGAEGSMFATSSIAELAAKDGSDQGAPSISSPDSEEAFCMKVTEAPKGIHFVGCECCAKKKGRRWDLY